MTPYIKALPAVNPCADPVPAMEAAFQKLILPTTGKMSTRSNFKAIICTQNRCDTTIMFH